MGPEGRGLGHAGLLDHVILRAMGIKDQSAVQQSRQKMMEAQTKMLVTETETKDAFKTYEGGNTAST